MEHAEIQKRFPELKQELKKEESEREKLIEAVLDHIWKDAAEMHGVREEAVQRACQEYQHDEDIRDLLERLVLAQEDILSKICNTTAATELLSDDDQTALLAYLGEAIEASKSIIREQEGIKEEDRGYVNIAERTLKYQELLLKKYGWSRQQLEEKMNLATQDPSFCLKMDELHESE